MNGEFYIGYRKVAPPRLARFVFAAAGVIVLGVLLAALVIGGSQQPAGDGRYDFGSVESFEGTLRAEPVHLDFGGRAALLVGQGKHGPPGYVIDAIGKRVRLGATRIERHGVLMLEVESRDSFHSLGDGEPFDARPQVEPEVVTLTGELVDTKCYLGVMNPGRGKVHRGCAAECLRGGVPPGLLVRDSDASSRVIVLRPPDDGSVAVDPEWAARVVTATGRLESAGGLTALRLTRLDLAES
jgi:hypothetical protein